MLKAVFTLDYEIHGNGEGCPRALMVEPTRRMLKLFDAYGARLTIMADVAEILKFKEYFDETGSDDYHYQGIAAQLKDALRRGHDVQLHLHASYFNARHENGRWVQDWSEYNFAGLSKERLKQIVRTGKEFLEALLRPVNPNYRCEVFRAANWAVSPSHNVVRALLENDLKVDTSVFKYGRREGLVNFDYTNACSPLLPWRVDENDICNCNPNGRLLEVPIYSEKRWAGAFLTPQRIYRAVLTRAHRVSQAPAPAPPATAEPNGHRNGSRKLHWLARRHAWKADFNQCSGRQLIRALERAEREFGQSNTDLPFVLIGHSKLFTALNDRSLRPFLAYVADRPQRFGFARFKDFDFAVPAQSPNGWDAAERGVMAHA